jgi:hypothetical protein
VRISERKGEIVAYFRCDFLVRIPVFELFRRDYAVFRAVFPCFDRL